MIIEIAIHEDSAKILRHLTLMPDRMLEEMRHAMDEQNQYSIGYISQNRLRGQGPYPVNEHRLGIVSGKLWQSLWAVPAVVSGQEILSGIGVPLRYGMAHEFGFAGDVAVRPHTRRRATGKGSDILVRGHRRKMKIPERAAIRYGLMDRDYIYGITLTAAIHEAWRALQ